jgi:hypothetical protein
VTLQSTKDDGIAVPSTFTDYDDASTRISDPAPPLRSLFSNNSGWDMQTSRHSLTLGRELHLARRRLQPREKTSPHLSSASADCPGSSHQLPVNPKGGHSGNCSNHSLHDCMLRRWSDHGLGINLCLARAWPRPK